MYPRRKSTLFAKCILFFIGVTNIIKGAFLHFIVGGNSPVLTSLNLGDRFDIFYFLLMMIGVLSIAYGIWNIVISLKYKKLLLLALFLEIFKGATIIVLEYIYLLPQMFKPWIYMQTGILAVLLLAFVCMLVDRYTKKYVFFDKRSLL